MKRIQRILTILLASILSACSTPPGQHHIDAEKTLSASPDFSADCPYFSFDHMGNPVLCWTEKNLSEGVTRLAFARYDITTGAFGTRIVVPGSEGIRASPESTGKIAFKSDGTIIAVFAKPFPEEKNPFAGAIYYSLSSDAGASWSPPRFLHSDTSHHYGRNFFDLAQLGNGEVGAVWLDGRDQSIEGSALYFSSTGSSGGFTNETIVHSGTCECCRTDLLVDKNGMIHVAYRSLTYPSSLAGKQVRDMAYVHSTDNGKTFSPESVISPDHWAIQACPHTGPALAWENGRLHAIWFTAGGGAGLYYTSMQIGSSTFNNRQMLTETGSHPQAAAIGPDTVYVVYENRSMDPPNRHGMAGGNRHGQDQHEISHTSGSPILLHPVINGIPAEPIRLSSDGTHNHHPVIANVSGSVLVAWVCEDGNRSTIRYRALWP